VDDDENVHDMTRMVLSDYSYQGAGLDFINAYSGREAKTIIRKNPDAACILLDVVMETNESGLEVVRYIREEEKNANLRIILRTGQPGMAPEKKVILDYDINDYKTKTELTSQKLFTAVTTAIRSYQHLKNLEKQQMEIKNKNRLLNEEIARRIVAESNLGKYSKSLERMLEDKRKRLVEALSTLERADEELKQAKNIYSIKDLSSQAAMRLEPTAETIKENLDIIEKYRIDMTLLLNQYEDLLQIISQHGREIHARDNARIEAIKQFSDKIDINLINENYPAIIKDCAKGIDQIKKTASDIKSFIRISSESKKRIDINQMVKKIIDQAEGPKNKTEGPKNKTIDIQMNFGELPEVEASFNSLQSALNALLDNAVLAVESLGLISISTSCENGIITISISDTGCGIDSVDLEKVFYPYFSSSRWNRTGLGLFFAKTVISSHNGKLDIESSKGQGTTVIIKLPVNPDI